MIPHVSAIYKTNFHKIYSLFCMPVIGTIFLLSASQASAECVTRKLEKAHVEKGDGSWRIDVPADKVPEYEMKGFKRVGCPAKADERVSARDAICKTARFGNEAVQKQFEIVFGERPKKMCEDAEAVLGKAPLETTTAPSGS